MRRLNERLRAWEREGILSAAQAEEILKFENRTRRSSPVAMAVLGLGVAAVAIGLVALVASHWDGISDRVKLASFFAIWGGLGALAYGGHAKGRLFWREGAMALFALFLFAGIGLVGQIFHLSGAPWKALAFWCGCTLFLALMARSLFLPLLWIAAALVTVFLAEGSSLLPWQHGILMGFVCGAWAFAIPFSDAAGWAAREVRVAARGAAITLATVGAAVASQTGWLLSNELQLRARLAFAVPAGCCAAAAAVAWMRRRPRGETVVLAAAAIALGSVLLGYQESPLWGCVGFLIPCVAASFHAARSGSIALFRICTAIIGIRFLAAYFEILGTLATTGAGLIAAGALCIAGVFVWQRIVRGGVSS